MSNWPIVTQTHLARTALQLLSEAKDDTAKLGKPHIHERIIEAIELLRLIPGIYDVEPIHLKSAVLGGKVSK